MANFSIYLKYLSLLGSGFYIKKCLFSLGKNSRGCSRWCSSRCLACMKLNTPLKLDRKNWDVTLNGACSVFKCDAKRYQLCFFICHIASHTRLNSFTSHDSWPWCVIIMFESKGLVSLVSFLYTICYLYTILSFCKSKKE